MHLLGFIGVAALFVFAVIALRNADVTACAARDDLNQTRGLVLAAVTVGGFGLGRLGGWFRLHVREGYYGAGRRSPRPGLVLDLALVIFLILAALLLGYETWAVANGGHPPPITSYVRCAAYHQLPLAAATAAAVGFIVSNWLWFPTR